MNDPVVGAMFYCLTEAEIFDHTLIDPALADIRRHGFDSIYLEYRNSKTPCSSPLWAKTIAHVCRAAARIGLAVFPAAPYGMAGDAIGRERPELLTESVKPVTLDLKNGEFTLKTTGDTLHTLIERAWLIQEQRPGVLKSAIDITKKLKRIGCNYEGGGCAMTEVRGPADLKLRYRLAGVKTGRIFLLMRKRFDHAGFDLGHPAMTHYADVAMDLFKGLPGVVGLAWDEPHYGFAFWPHNGRAISDRMYTVFKKRFGYDLRTRLIDLWFDVPGRSAALTRYHYAELLETGLAGLEQHFYKRCMKRYTRKGREAFVGIHRTMHEELSDDFLIGCADYFRHNEALSGGFTDSVFERDDSMTTMISLARSMAPLTESGLAYNNSWGFRPTEAHHDYYLTLMGAMNVRWIGHAYRSSYMFGPGYPDHPLWSTLKGHVTEHARWIKQLTGATPLADTAVLWNWAAPGSCADATMHVHRRTLLLLGRTLTEDSVQFLFISGDQLAKAKIRTASFSTETGIFTRLIVPWPDLLDPAAFAALEKLAEAGVELLFMGPPARITTDGRDVSTRFAALTGIKPVGDFQRVQPGSTVQYENRRHKLAPLTLQPNYMSNPKQTYPDHFRAYPLRPLRGSEAMIRMKTDVVGVRKDNVTYVAIEVPHYVGLTSALLDGAGLELPADAIGFEYEKDGKRLLAIVGEWSRPIAGRIDWCGSTITLGKTKGALLECAPGRKPIVCGP